MHQSLNCDKHMNSIITHFSETKQAGNFKLFCANCILNNPQNENNIIEITHLEEWIEKKNEFARSFIKENDKTFKEIKHAFKQIQQIINQKFIINIQKIKNKPNAQINNIINNQAALDFCKEHFYNSVQFQPLLIQLQGFKLDVLDIYKCTYNIQTKLQSKYKDLKQKYQNLERQAQVQASTIKANSQGQAKLCNVIESLQSKLNKSLDLSNNAMQRNAELNNQINQKNESISKLETKLNDQIRLNQKLQQQQRVQEGGNFAVRPQLNRIKR